MRVCVGGLATEAWRATGPAYIALPMGGREVGGWRWVGHNTPTHRRTAVKQGCKGGHASAPANLVSGPHGMHRDVRPAPLHLASCDGGRLHAA